MEAQAIFRWWYVGGEKLVLYTKEIKVMICYTKGEKTLRILVGEGSRSSLGGGGLSPLRHFATSSLCHV